MPSDYGPLPNVQKLRKEEMIMPVAGVSHDLASDTANLELLDYIRVVCFTSNICAPVRQSLGGDHPLLTSQS